MAKIDKLNLKAAHGAAFCITKSFLSSHAKRRASRAIFYVKNNIHSL
jgi:hypothetical protein